MRTCCTPTSAPNWIHCTRRVIGGSACATRVLLAAASILIPSSVFAQSLPLEATAATGTDPGAPPMSQSGNVDFFSQDLGSIVRLRYNTESYGQDGQGNFDVGTMQVITMEDNAAILDGQVTMNDADGVGFNVGVGYRWMNFPPYSMDTGRIDGIALWADGTHTAAGNFFPQIGVSYESLGESWDLRSNIYVPLGPQEQVGNFKPTGEIGFEGNSISQLTQAIVDSSFTVGELEVARRLGAGRDAWAFAGPYFLTNDDDDTAGYRVGVRGYAFPDLLVQVAVSDDEIFNTYATFQVQWFVGRTRTDFHPTCGVPDRMREPFMRNDYVALAKSTKQGGVALTQPDGSALRVVHFDSTAAAGGDGTFERPFNELNLGGGTGSQAGDILFAHSTSSFNTGITLKNNQRLLGEGNNLEHTVATLEEGTITIPESATGARALARPTINIAAASDAIALADNNEVSNFDMDGQSLAGNRAIVGFAMDGAGNPNLNNLSIHDTGGDAILFSPGTITDTDDLDNDNNTTEQFVRGSVTINEVDFLNIGGDDISIDSATTTDITLPTVTLQEVIAISNVTSTSGNGRGIRIANTHSGAGRTATLSNYTYDGGTTSDGAILLTNFDSTFTASSSTLTSGQLGGAGVELLGDTDGTINFQSTVAFNNLDGTAFKIDGLDGATDAFGGNVTVAGAITNDTGLSVLIENLGAGAMVAFNGNITDTGEGMLVNSNSGGNVTFIGDLAMTIDTPAATAVKLTSNSGANIDFAGDVVIAATGNANGFVAMDGGTISAPSTVNSVTTETGQAVVITNMTIAAGDVRFGDVNRTAAAATSAVDLETNDGAGAIIIGNTTDTAGQAGTIVGGTADAVLVKDSANVSITGLRIDNTSSVSGVRVEKSNTAAMNVDLSDLELNGGDIGLETVGGGTGALTMTVNDTNINGSTARGMVFNNVDVGTVAVNNAIIDGNNANPAAGGVLITDSNATITFDSASRIREFGGDDFEVSGGSGIISFAGGIVNSSTTNALDTTGNSVFVHNITGGSVTFATSSTVNDDNEGVRIEDNTGGSISLAGNNDLNTGSADAVTIDNNTGATISLSDLDIDTTTGQGLVATGGGTLSVIGFSNTITRTAGGATGRALDIENMTIGAVDFESVNATGGANGIRLVNNTGGTVTIGDTNNTANQGGTITGTVDAAVHATNANVTLNGVTATNAGNAAGENAVEIFHTNTTAMNANLNQVTVTNATAGRDGVVIDGTGGSGTFNANVQNTSINVTGDGFVANSGVTLTAGGATGNTITTATGVGLSLTNVAIAGAGANFQSVNVTNGATNGIVMTNVTGGQVAVTGTGTTQNSGGALTTTGDAIVLSNVSNVDLLNMQVVSAGGQGLNIDHSGAATAAMDVTLTNLNLDATANEGIDVLSANGSNAFTLRLTNSDIEERVEVSHTAAGAFTLLLDNNAITTTGADIAFSLAFSGSAQDGDVTIRNSNTFTAADATAFNFTANGTNIDVEFLMDNNTFTNSSATGETANFVINGGATLNANVVNNTFTNSLAADEFYMESDGSTTMVNLNLDNNTSGGVYHLFTQNQGVPTVDFNFNVVDRDNADANNGGTVTFDPAINQFGDISGPVESPPVLP